MKNAILKYNFLLVENTQNIFDTNSKMLFPMYDFIKIQKIREIVKSLNEEEYMGYISIDNNTTLEKISNDIYNTTDFWDILLIINNRDCLIGMPYDYDVVYDSAENDIKKYEDKILKRKLSPNERERFRSRFMDKITENNEQYRIIKYIYPEKIYEFMQILRDNDIK